MDAAVADTAIKVYLKEIYTRLEAAASIAKAADACAEAAMPTRACGSPSISSNWSMKRPTSSTPLP